MRKKNKAASIILPDFSQYCSIDYSNQKSVVLTQKWDRIDSSQVNSPTYSQLICNKGGKNIQWRKKKSLQQVESEKLDILM